MKKHALRKEFFREIQKSLPRFLSILFIVALGTAFYSGIQSSSPDMRYSGDAYYDEKNLMDLQVTGTLGVTQADAEALQEIPEIEEAELTYLKDVLTGEEGEQTALRVLSIPEKMNLLTLEEGTYPIKTEECLMDVAYAERQGYQIGDILQVSEEEKILTTDTFKITGFCSSPLYISFSRGSTNIGNGEVSGFLYVQPETFDTEYAMQISVKAEGAETLTAYTPAYEKRIQKAQAALEAAEAECCQARYDEVQAEAQEKVSDAAQELADKKQETTEKLADAKKELEDAQQKLTDGKEELADKKQELLDGKQELAKKEQELADAKKQLADGESQLQKTEKQLSQQEKTFQKQKNTAQKKLTQSEKKLAQGEKTLNANKKTLEAQKAAFAQQKTTYQQGRKQYEQKLAEYESSIQQGVPDQILTEAKQQLDATKKQLDEAQVQITAGEKELEAAEKQLKAAEKELNSGKSELEKSKKQLKSGEQQLKTARETLNKEKQKLKDSKQQLAEGEQQLAEAKKKLTDGEQQMQEAEETIAKNEKKLSKGWRKYEKSKKKAEKKIAKAEKKIVDAQKEVDDLEMPTWTISDRDDLLDYTNYGENADRLRNIGEVFPVIFFLVAALISLTTMTRMVEEERTQIGTLKALGYSKKDIAAKYMLYALLATALGSILGILVGEKILPYIVIRAYGIMYPYMNTIKIPYNLKFAAIAAGAAIFCTMIATLEACVRELHAWPAVLMRPPAPKNGKRVWLEKIPFLWKNLSFTWKSTIRNLFRYKKRFFMTIIGIGGCMALLLVGFGLRDSIMDVAILQYQDIQMYDGMIILDEEAKTEEEQVLQEELKKDSAVEAFTEIYMKKVEFATEQRKLDVYLMILPDRVSAEEFITFRSRTTKESYELDDTGMILTEKSAKLLGVSEGDEVTKCETDQEEVKIKVSHISENYMSHFAYMTESTYCKLYGEIPEYNSILYRVTDREETLAAKAGERAMKCSAALSVSYTSNTKEQLDQMLTALDSVIIVLILSAGMLAFVVLYNLNNININERKRELATIKVLGFYDKEVSAYVYRENILLTLLGSVFGIFLGMFLHRFIIVTVEVDMCMFGRNISFGSYAVSAAITYAFSAFVNVVMHFKLKKIDMVESLKSVE